MFHLVDLNLSKDFVRSSLDGVNLSDSIIVFFLFDLELSKFFSILARMASICLVVSLKCLQSSEGWGSSWIKAMATMGPWYIVFALKGYQESG